MKKNNLKKLKKMALNDERYEHYSFKLRVFTNLIIGLLILIDAYFTIRNSFTIQMIFIFIIIVVIIVFIVSIIEERIAKYITEKKI